MVNADSKGFTGAAKQNIQHRVAKFGLQVHFVSRSICAALGEWVSDLTEVGETVWTFSQQITGTPVRGRYSGNIDSFIISSICAFK